MAGAADGAILFTRPGERRTSYSRSDPVVSDSTASGDQAICEAAIREVAGYILGAKSDLSEARQAQLRNLQIAPLSEDEVFAGMTLIKDEDDVKVFGDDSMKDVFGNTLVTRKVTQEVSDTEQIAAITRAGMRALERVSSTSRKEVIAVSKTAWEAVQSYASSLNSVRFRYFAAGRAYGPPAEPSAPVRADVPPAEPPAPTGGFAIRRRLPSGQGVRLSPPCPSVPPPQLATSAAKTTTKCDPR